VTSASLTLVLGATGKTGSRVANRLVSRGLPVRTAARSGADAHFDWDDPRTYAPALHGVNRVYLLGPVMRTDFAGQVSVFLDQAEAAGTRHVTYLSAYGIDSAPPETAMRSVELDLLGRPGLTHAILRPAWFMQNFSETFLRPTGGTIVVPAGDGAEAFVDAEDIAAVASACRKAIRRGRPVRRRGESNQAAQRSRAAADRAYRIVGLFQATLRAGGDHHVSAKSRQLGSRRRTNAAACAGDEGDAAGEWVQWSSASRLNWRSELSV